MYLVQLLEKSAIFCGILWTYVKSTATQLRKISEALDTGELNAAGTCNPWMD